MATTTTGTAYEHIVLDESGVPWIVGANTKIVELVSEVHAYGWSPAELHSQHPHLSLGQIHSALAYYWDHKDEIDVEVQRRLEEAETLRRDAEPSPGRLQSWGWRAPGRTSRTSRSRAKGRLRTFRASLGDVLSP